MKLRIAACGILGLIVFGGDAAAADPPDRGGSVDLFRSLRASDQAPIVPHRSQLYRALVDVVEPGAWAPGSSVERLRGPIGAIYARVAPAIVVVRTEDGHGTGFLVEPDGWIVTNHHVIADAVPDGETGAKRVTVHLGRMHDGFMTIVEEGLPAHVYKESEEQDLALLKLANGPPGGKPLPVIGLADQSPAIGDDCVSIGHPRAATLWFARMGTVSGVGQWPQDRIDVVMRRLVASGKDRENLNRALTTVKSRKVLISTCGINPGDSGGPLLDVKGQLIGVSFAVPAVGEGEHINIDKFSYHVHLDEVRAFLKGDRPAKPLIYAPDPWPAATSGERLDLDGDGVPDTLIFFDGRDKPPTGLLLDLDQDTPGKLGAKSLDEIVKSKAFDFEVALHFRPTPRAFYDTDDDGRIDLVLTASASRDDESVSVQRLEKGAWVKGKPRGGKILDTSLIKDDDARARLVQILRKLSKK